MSAVNEIGVEHFQVAVHRSTVRPWDASAYPAVGLWGSWAASPRQGRVLLQIRKRLDVYGFVGCLHRGGCFILKSSVLMGSRASTIVSQAANDRRMSNRSRYFDWGGAMRIGELTSFAHNVADSLASGICFMAGVYPTDIYGEAASSPEGHIVVDFKKGSTSGSPASPGLQRAVQRFCELLPELAKEHGLDASEINVLMARFGTDPVAGRHFSVTVEAIDGRRSVDQYVGSPGRRFGKACRSSAADQKIGSA